MTRLDKYSLALAPLPPGIVLLTETFHPKGAEQPMTEELTREQQVLEMTALPVRPQVRQGSMLPEGRPPQWDRRAGPEGTLSGVSSASWLSLCFECPESEGRPPKVGRSTRPVGTLSEALSTL